MKIQNLLTNHAPMIWLNSFRDKIKLISSISLILLLVLFSENLSAQSNDWNLAADKDGIQIFYQKTLCEEEPVVLLKFVNSNASTAKVQWEEYVTFEGMDELKLYPGFFNLEIETGITEATSCDGLVLLQLISRPNRLFAQFHTDYEEGEIPVNPLMTIDTFRIEGVVVSLN